VKNKMGKIFKLNEKYSIVCVSEGTKYGFRHLATLYVNNSEGWVKAKCCYYNRTWESFEFQTVALLLIEKAQKENIFTETETEQFRAQLKR
jgi:hypothetical protein